MTQGRQVGTVGRARGVQLLLQEAAVRGRGRDGERPPMSTCAARVRLLRSHAMTSSTWDRHRGHDPAYDVVDIGFNYRLDEPRAALGLSRLARLDEDIAAGARSCAPTASGSRDVRGTRARRSTSRPSSAPRTSPSRCCWRDRADARPLPRRAQSAGHPDDVVSGAAHLHRVPAARAGGRPAAGRRGRRPPLRAAAERDDGRVGRWRRSSRPSARRSPSR